MTPCREHGDHLLWLRTTSNSSMDKNLTCPSSNSPSYSPNSVQQRLAVYLSLESSGLVFLGADNYSYTFCPLSAPSNRRVHTSTQIWPG